MSPETKPFGGGNGNAPLRKQITFDDGDNRLRVENGSAIGVIRTLGNDALYLAQYKDVHSLVSLQ